MPRWTAMEDKVQESTSEELTRILIEIDGGETQAIERLWRIVYDEIHDMAKGLLNGDNPGNSLNSTILVHEVYAKLFGKGAVRFENRRHFFGAAGRAMRQVRIDYLRTRKPGKRPVSESDAIDLSFNDDDETVFAIDEALRKLDEIDTRKVEVVNLRYFVGLGVKQIAAVLGVSERTVKSDWHFARAWLLSELDSSGLAS